MTFDRLLAKSTSDPARPREAETLRGHTALVMASATSLLEERGRASLAAAGLVSSDITRLKAIVRLAAFLHDLGKCSDHFQSMVRGTRQAPQLVRHEALGLWLCWPGRILSSWLRGAVETDFDYLISLVAAAGHHRKFPSHAIASDEVGAGNRLVLLTSHEDFVSTLRTAGFNLGLGTPPEIADDIVLEVSRRSDPRQQLDEFESEWNDAVSADGSLARLVAVCKALVIPADVAGSALPKGGEQPSWINIELRRRPTPERLRGLVTHNLSGAPLRPFQTATAESTAPLTLLRAGCGTGKTGAAYLWAAQHVGRQLWVTYPTTGTTTEGFRDYIFGADVAGRLEHSRAEVDIEIFGLHDAANGLRERDRLDAIRAWGSEVVTCTVDTVLGLIQNQRKGLYAWPGLAQSALVFDEIHAYDSRLFGSLLRFLEALPGLPVLLMTASLPARRLEQLRELALRIHRRPLAEIPGPADLETLPRYVRLPAEDPLKEVEHCLTAGGKVLWVSNTVKRCRAVAEKTPGTSPIIYHSRFRYIDRVRRHGAVIDAFRRAGAAFASTTQVAEISLDLSADLLITDLAPIPALIQRLGRLNRRATPDAPIPPRPFVVLPFRGLPYDDRELEVAAEWLSNLRDGPLSQRDLVRGWADEDQDEEGTIWSRWLDGGFQTEPDAVRDASPGLTVLLETDSEAVRTGTLDATAAALPMPPPPSSVDWRNWSQVEFLPVAPAAQIDYDPLQGARWAKH